MADNLQLRLKSEFISEPTHVTCRVIVIIFRDHNFKRCLRRIIRLALLYYSLILMAFMSRKYYIQKYPLKILTDDFRSGYNKYNKLPLTCFSKLSIYFCFMNYFFFVFGTYKFINNVKYIFTYLVINY